MVDQEIINKIFKLKELNISIRDVGDLVGLPKSTVWDILQKKQFISQFDDKRILVIGDLHTPFTLIGYREFCYKIYIKYQCNHVIFMGDIIDNHFSSYHEINPDGMSAGDELNSAIREIKEWNKLFPIADVVTGNHDLIQARKFKTSGLSNAWLKSFNEVLDVPNWTFSPNFFYDGVLYRHGVNASGATSILSDGCSIVQGHFHSSCRLNWKVGKGGKVFGLQCPCGVDDKSYAMAYNESRKSIIGCAVVLEDGRLPIIELMDL